MRIIVQRGRASSSGAARPLAAVARRIGRHILGDGGDQRRRFRGGGLLWVGLVFGALLCGLWVGMNQLSPVRTRSRSYGFAILSHEIAHGQGARAPVADAGSVERLEDSRNQNRSETNKTSWRHV